MTDQEATPGERLLKECWRAVAGMRYGLGGLSGAAPWMECRYCVCTRHREHAPGCVMLELERLPEVERAAKAYLNIHRSSPPDDDTPEAWSAQMNWDLERDRLGDELAAALRRLVGG